MSDGIGDVTGDLAGDVTGIDQAELTVVLDVRHPFSYLALEPAIAFGAKHGLEINWLPIRSKPLKAPTTPGPDDDRSILHRRNRAQMIAREIETYASAAGLTIRDYYRDPDPSALHLGLLYARSVGNSVATSFLRESFRGYWAGELAPDDVEAIAKIVVTSGGDSDAFEIWCEAEGPALDAQIAADLNARGVTVAPGYLVQGEFFHGRQHLPMIEWILGGREGPVPI